MEKNIIRSFQILVFLLVVACQPKQKDFTIEEIKIIPKPVSVQLNTGSFEINDATVFVIENEQQKLATTALNLKLKKAAGFELNIVALNEAPEKNKIVFQIEKSLVKEGYSIASNSDEVLIKANDYVGFFYGLQTIRQLLPVEIEKETIQNSIDWLIPSLTINDAPRFAWRGFMLDVSRHFFDKAYILELIDGLALHKINTLHLHLVDDQGWRIEIKKYPKLTSVGGFRVDQEDKHWGARDNNKATDEATFGGFYTQEDMKEIVAYAADKGINIVPEIEMPAHVMSAVAAYPEYSCLEEPIGVPSGGVWPITDIFCAGKDSTFEFLEDVLSEVMDLFPSKYIHIGGDEATKTNWKICKHCQSRMKSEGLHDVEELQSYFIKRIDKFISSKDRVLVGWDEILEGGLAKGATVMSWRGFKNGIAAAQQGNDVVMTPTGFAYFDYYQGPQDEEPLAWGGDLPLSKVYKFEPVPAELTKEEAKHIIGGQANLWTEYVPTNEQAEYMMYPRIAALAESVWTPKEAKDWTDFSGRMEGMFQRYNNLGLNYAKSAYLITHDSKVDIENKVVEVLLQNEFPNSDIRYTTDGSDVNKHAQKYDAPIKTVKTTTVKASLFKDGKLVGKQMEKTIKFHKGIAKKVSYKSAPNSRYTGAGDVTFVNTLRGSKNFHDGQWQAWLSDDMEVVIDLENKTVISEVVVGAMENQGPGIYYPVAFEILISHDGEIFENVGKLERPFAKNASSELKDFKVKFEEQEARFVKVIVTNLKKAPNGGGVFMFIDEILIN